MGNEALYSLIEARTGTQLKDNRLNRLQRLLQDLLDQMPAVALLNSLMAEPLFSPLWQRVIQEITVGETYFFRNQPQFDALRDLILPRLIAQRRAADQRYLRLWSAGCATGEEPYSLAILLRDLLPDWREWSLFILATDINQTMLETAAQGLYRAASFRGETPTDIQGRFFRPHQGLFQLDATVRQMVTFRPLNLIQDSYPSLETFTINHDIVLCRNVTIYFDNEQTRGVVNRLYGALRDEGWLLVGHAEPQLHVYDAFSMIPYEGTILYQKRRVAAPQSARPAPPPVESPAAPPPQVIEQPVMPPVPPAAKALDLEQMLRDARAAADQENWPLALRLLEQLEPFQRSSAQFHFVRALVLAQSDMDAALEALGQAVYCDPSFAIGHFWQGELWAQRGAMHRAVTCWRRADKALDGIPDHALLPGEVDMTAAMLRDLLDYRLAEG